MDKRREIANLFHRSLVLRLNIHLRWGGLAFAFFIVGCFSHIWPVVGCFPQIAQTRRSVHTQMAQIFPTTVLKKLVDLQSRYDQWIYFLQNLENMEVIPELFMTDTKFKKALTIAEIAKMKPEEALQHNPNVSLI